MTTVNLGRVKPIHRGEYSAAYQYQALDFVQYGAATYVCTAPSKGNVPTNTAFFQPVAATGQVDPSPNAIPRANDQGVVNLNWLGADIAARIMMAAPQVNNIGVPGTLGFGVGICPRDYPGMSPLAGTFTKGDEYGNYQYTDGSVMVWVPAFFYRYGHTSNPTYAAYGVNSVHVVPRSAYPTVLAAAVAGYALHRAFYDDDVEQPGVFVDKYKCSNSGGIASSVKGGNTLTASAAHYPFSGLTGTPANTFAGAIAAAKTRGVDFFPGSTFISGMLALLSLAHAQASKNSTVCAWYDAAGVNSFPKGCNNNALGDANDASVAYTSTGHETYPLCGKTGSGVPFSKTTHSGQACGIADINGLMYEVILGVTVLSGSYYILNKSARMAALTAGVTLETDAWGALGVAKNYLLLGTSFGTMGTEIGASRAIGSANQVLSSATDGLEWSAACAGIPLVGGTGGANLFGNDRFYDAMPEHMCLAGAGSWSHAAYAGPWIRSCYYSRTTTNSTYGFRSALYLEKKSDSE